MNAEVPGLVDEVLRSSGRPLDASTRTYFEPRFGHNFSHVRVHTDGQAAHSAETIRARAYTAGRDVVFASGEFSPTTYEGYQLLAHELAHVIQNASAPGPSVIRRTPGGGSAPYEIISPVWSVSGRDIVVVRKKATAEYL